MNVFTKAKTIETASPKGKKSAVPEVTISELEDLSIFDLGIKTLTTLKAAAELGVKAAMKEYFIKTGVKSKSRPVNFKGVEGIATASCEMRDRSSASGLSTAEQELLAKYNIPTETVTVTTETFIINPAYLNDSALLEKVGNVIGKVKGIPDDFIQKQQGAQRTIVSKDAIEKLFALGNEQIASELFSVVSTLAVKPTVTDVKAALGRITDMLLAAAE